MTPRISFISAAIFAAVFTISFAHFAQFLADLGRPGLAILPAALSGLGMWWTIACVHLAFNDQPHNTPAGKS